MGVLSSSGGKKCLALFLGFSPLEQGGVVLAVSFFRERKVCSSNVSLKVMFSFSFLFDFLEIIMHTMDLLKHKPILVMYCNAEWALGNHTVHLLPLHGTLVLLN